jgi:L,D-transpeptidase YcbB
MKEKLKYFIFPSFAFLFFILFSCNTSNNKKKLFLNSQVNSTKIISDLKIDSNVLVQFFKENKISDSIIKEVVKYYKDREYNCSWITSKGLTQAASSFNTQLQNYTLDFEDSVFYNIQLDTLIKKIKLNKTQFLSNKKNIENLELLLTATFFEYANKVYGGIAQSSKILKWYIPRNKKNYQGLLDSLLNNETTFQEPVNKFYTTLKDKLRQYRDIEKKGGFSKKIIAKKTLLWNDVDSCMYDVKYHLHNTGDLKINDGTNIFTDSVQMAIMHYQKRFGLKESGKLDAVTIAEMNKPIAYRIKQMMLNLERLRWVSTDIEKDYLLVNIPEFKLHIFENDQLVWETNVVVGKVLTQTTIFKGDISQIVLNPYWNVPNSIYKKEIQGKSNKYLIRHNMESYNGSVRQKPGDDNALGKVKFLFPNSYNIYLHDTPSKTLFDEPKRGFSHGCIRVQEPIKLALYLLKKDKNWNATKVDSIMLTNKEYPINLLPVMPVYIAYFTAWVNSEGQLNFRSDIYNLDEKLAKEIFGK